MKVVTVYDGFFMNKINICIFLSNKQFSNNCHMAYFYATFTVLFNAVCWH